MMLRKSNWVLVGIVVIAVVGFQSASWSFTAHVTLFGDEEGWVGQNLNYFGEVWLELDEDEQRELADGEGELNYEYVWDFDGGECTSPPAEDGWETCMFSWPQGG